MEKNRLSTSYPAQLSRSGPQPVWVLNSHHRARPPAAPQSSPSPPDHFSFHRLACQLPTCLVRVRSAERGIGLVSWGCLKGRHPKLGNWLNSKMWFLIEHIVKGYLAMLGKCRDPAVLLTRVQTLVLPSCVTMGKADLFLWPRAPSRPFHQLKLQTGFALLQGG